VQAAEEPCDEQRDDEDQEDADELREHRSPPDLAVRVTPPEAVAVRAPVWELRELPHEKARAT
jgi:hypothetical protein